jgi:NAD(P)-dependent dehydrogenase (short-subunit alcohol dehydrogenase family)
MDLQNKIIVITGGGSGIGKALVKRFKQEGAKQIVVVDINAAHAEAVASEFACVAMSADVSKEEDIKRVIQETEANIGPIDLFCSNAGVGLGDTLDSPNKEWQLSWDINVMPHVYAARHLAPLMVERGGGYFLNTASAAGLLNQIGGAAYAVTKHAAVGFAEWLAIHYKHQGIKVSLLCPQAVRTPMTEGDHPAAKAASVNGMMEPDTLAEVVVEQLHAESFLILPHDEVLGYMQAKTSNYDRWIGGMNKLMMTIMGKS